MLDNSSRFSKSYGILFAADIKEELSAVAMIRTVASEIAGIKLGSALLYRYGPKIISRIKNEFGLPVIVDTKITDVAHIAEQVALLFADAGADAVTVSGICGPTVITSVCRAVNPSCEVWLFTEFTDNCGLLDEYIADRVARIGIEAGATGIQAPGNRPDRVKEIRSIVGATRCVMSCGMGTQGGEIGKAVSAGANFEIIGRSIYDAPHPAEAARYFREQIEKSV